MRTYAIRHVPTGAWMPSRMHRSRPGGWSHWIPQTPALDGWVGCDGFDKNPRLFFTKRSVQNALTAWLMGVHRRETWNGYDWEGTPDSSDEHIIGEPPIPRVRQDMEIVEFELRPATSIDTPEFRTLLMAVHAAETRFEAVAGTQNQYVVFEEASQARQALIAYIDDPERQKP